MFEELGFRGFAARARATTKTAGAAKNAELLVGDRRHDRAARPLPRGPVRGHPGRRRPGRVPVRRQRRSAFRRLEGDLQARGHARVVDDVPQAAQEAEAVRLRPGDDRPRPAAVGHRRLRVLLEGGGGLLPARPRAGRRHPARPGRRPHGPEADPRRPGGREGQPEHQVRPARPAARRASSCAASPATRWSPTTCCTPASARTTSTS